MAHETIFEDHQELLRTHEKLRLEKLNLEQEHEFLKAINDDLRKKSSSYIAKRLLLSTYMPQVKSSNKNKKDSSSSSNNNHAKSNVVASSSSLDSTNDSLRQFTLEQENSLLKGIIEKGVYKSLAGSKQFEEIVRKQGRHRKNQGVGFERKFNANGVEWEEDNTPRRSLFLNKRSMILLPSRGHKLKMIFHHKTTSRKARTSFKRRLMHLKKLLRPWSSGFPRLLQVPLHQVRLQLQGFPSR